MVASVCLRLPLPASACLRLPLPDLSAPVCLCGPVVCLCLPQPGSGGIPSPSRVRGLPLHRSLPSLGARSVALGISAPAFSSSSESCAQPTCLRLKGAARPLLTSNRTERVLLWTSCLSRADSRGLSPHFYGAMYISIDRCIAVSECLHITVSRSAYICLFRAVYISVSVSLCLSLSASVSLSLGRCRCRCLSLSIVVSLPAVMCLSVWRVLSTNIYLPLSASLCISMYLYVYLCLSLSLSL